MQPFQELKGIEVYLIDQFLKDRISKNSRVLDAGCGSGRNIHYLLKSGYTVTAIDRNEIAIQQLKTAFPKNTHHFSISSIEDFQSEQQFDFIICNAVLHFAQSHSHFETMFAKLVQLLSKNGVLFIRMTSTMGLDPRPQEIENGVFDLKDGTERYLISREQITELIEKHQLNLLDPVKSVLVEDLRSMCTLVFGKGWF